MFIYEEGFIGKYCVFLHIITVYKDCVAFSDINFYINLVSHVLDNENPL
jgi:hypothetical protein